MAISYAAAIAEVEAGVADLAAALAETSTDAWTNGREQALERLRRALVRTDYNGVTHAESSSQRFGLGASPIVALAFLRSLEALLSPLLCGTPQANTQCWLAVAPNDVQDRDRWIAGLPMFYEGIEQVRAATGDEYPSEAVWKGFILPMLMGWMFSLNATTGRWSFARQEPPAVVRPMSVLRNAAWMLDNVSKLDETVAHFDTWLVKAQTATRTAIVIIEKWANEQGAAVIDAVTKPVKTVAKWLPWAIVGGVAVGLAWFFGGKRKSS